MKYNKLSILLLALTVLNVGGFGLLMFSGFLIFVPILNIVSYAIAEYWYVVDLIYVALITWLLIKSYSQISKYKEAGSLLNLVAVLNVVWIVFLIFSRFLPLQFSRYVIGKIYEVKNSGDEFLLWYLGAAAFLVVLFYLYGLMKPDKDKI